MFEYIFRPERETFEEEILSTYKRVMVIRTEENKEFSYSLKEDEDGIIFVQVYTKENGQETKIGNAMAVRDKENNRIYLKRGSEGREAIHVNSEYREKYSGIGKSIMAMLLRYARDTGMSRFDVEAVAPSAAPFYLKLGFVPKDEYLDTLLFPLEEEETARRNLAIPLEDISRTDEIHMYGGARLDPEEIRQSLNGRVIANSKGEQFVLEGRVEESYTQGEDYEGQFALRSLSTDRIIEDEITFKIMGNQIRELTISSGKSAGEDLYQKLLNVFVEAIPEGAAVSMQINVFDISEYTEEMFSVTESGDMIDEESGRGIVPFNNKELGLEGIILAKRNINYILL